MGDSLSSMLVGDENSFNASKTFVGFAMAIHLIINIIIAAIVNDKANLNKGGLQGGPVQRCFSAHTIISCVVIAILFFIKITGWFPVIGVALKQDLIKDGFIFISIPLFVHFVVSIIFAVISFKETDVNKVKNLSNIYNGISTAACIVIFIISVGFKYEQLKEMAKESKQGSGTETTGTEITADKAEPTAETPDVKVETKKPAETPTENPLTVETTEKKAFGKRQRRRNPPKRRKKKY
tara:strand:+ start:476 stop:1189 length:714 start_codon:yes stop_codon:yes gene_type:complete